MWTAHATRLDRFVWDVAFRVAADLYVGPENDMTPREWAESRVLLPAPGLPVAERDGVLTVDLLGREEELARHYERVIAAAAAHGKLGKLAHPFPYFALQPVIRVGDQSLASFVWYDDLHETIAVLEALLGGEPYDDLEQGWAIRILQQDGTTYFIEWNWEDDADPLAGYAMDSAELNRQAAATLERLRVIHERLVARFGRDYWSYVPPNA